MVQWVYQVTPPGINLIWLPYKDDIRHPELDNSFLGPKFAAGATAEQVKAAEAMLSELEIQDFAPGCIPNPHLQRHFQVILPVPGLSHPWTVQVMCTAAGPANSFENLQSPA